jgi:hypothetical protein
VTLFYIHIPKTGGQTLAARLASAFLPEHTWFMQRELRFPEDREFLEELKNSKKFIESHITGQLLEDFHDLDLLTTVREPLSQIISHYRHIRREPENRLHRAARTLAPEAFFDAFDNFFVNHQTRYLLSAFHAMHEEIIQKGYNYALHTRLYASIDRLRWLVPTEAIDEFITLWSLETRRPVPSNRNKVNLAPEDDCDVAFLRDLLLARPHLYAFDALLWQIARDHFAAYRAKLHESLAPWSWPDNSRRAYARGDAGIWLDENWYDPEVSDANLSWWAGPGACSSIRYRRTDEDRILSFDVTVVNGIEREDIRVYRKRDFGNVAVDRLTLAPDQLSYRIGLEGLEKEGHLLLVVPDVMAPIMISTSDPSVERRSFLATNWALSQDEVEAMA